MITKIFKNRVEIFASFLLFLAGIAAISEAFGLLGRVESIWDCVTICVGGIVYLFTGHILFRKKREKLTLFPTALLYATGIFLMAMASVLAYTETSEEKSLFTAIILIGVGCIYFFGLYSLLQKRREEI